MTGCKNLAKIRNNVIFRRNWVLSLTGSAPAIKYKTSSRLYASTVIYLTHSDCLSGI
jgi:hypothetical protein